MQLFTWNTAEMIKCLVYLFLLIDIGCFVLHAVAKIEQVASDSVELLLEPQCSQLKRQDIESHLSTKTPYRVVANLDDKPITYPGTIDMLQYKSLKLQ